MKSRSLPLLLLLFTTRLFAANDPASTTTPTTTDTPGPSSPGLTPESLQLRDPFQQRLTEISVRKKVSPLLQYSVDSFKVVGLLTGPKNIRALLADPQGKTYIVTEDTPIGNRSGVIKQITGDAVWIREKVLNLLGQEETVDTILSFVGDPREEMPVRQINADSLSGKEK